MSIRYLINDNGAPFDSSEVKLLCEVLDTLNSDERVKYRNRNASAIAQHDATRFLIVSGPGTGKSCLFMQKIVNWYHRDQDANVLVTSFVRKLVADLQNDIVNDEKLTDGQKKMITANTLHKFARSIVEKNHGTIRWPYKPYCRIMSHFWNEIVWNDVFAFFPSIEHNTYSLREFETQMHRNAFDNSNEWKELKRTYLKLCQLYNAAGFADLILRATKALAENPNLIEHDYFIIDEYQDFNPAEEALINQLLGNPKGVLIVGDDEQILYDTLKSSEATLIRNLYKDNTYSNAMLPFCSRSSYHITKTADYFIQQNREPDCIEKVYLPLSISTEEQKIQVIACATPATAVDYIEKFIADSKTEIDERRKELVSGVKKDAYLLILTPGKEINFYGQSKEKLRRLASEYMPETRAYSEDYYRQLGYYSIATEPHNNFTFRKLLYYECIPEDRVHKMIEKAIQAEKDFCDLDFQEIKTILRKCNRIKTILDCKDSIANKIDQISLVIPIANREVLQEDIKQRTTIIEEEEDVELEEIEVKRMGAIELMTIVGSKGLSADHVIIIGFDNVNMSWITKNAFYVAITRARKSLHIITALSAGGSSQPHAYLNNLPEEHLEFYSYKKGDRSMNFLGSRQGFINYLEKIRSVRNSSRYKTSKK